MVDEIDDEKKTKRVYKCVRVGDDETRCALVRAQSSTGAADETNVLPLP